MSLPKNWKRSARRVQRVAKSAIDKSKVLAGLELVEFGLAAQVLHDIREVPCQPAPEPVVSVGRMLKDAEPSSPWPGDWAWAHPTI